MTILLTGSEGFVGTMIQKSLANENHQVICLDKVIRDKPNYFYHDLSDSDNIELINELRGFDFDMLIHLAAAKGDYNLGYNDFYRDNVIASSELVQILESLKIVNLNRST